MPRQPGAYRANVVAVAPDGIEVGRVQSGWSTNPAAEEFKELKPNKPLLDRIAKMTGGQRVEPTGIESFAKTLPNRYAVITEPYIRPLWHEPWLFLLAIVCLSVEWGLRRWKGLP